MGTGKWMQSGTMVVIWTGHRELNFSSVDNGGKTSPESQPLPLNCNCDVWSLFPSHRSSLALSRLRWMGVTFRNSCSNVYFIRTQL